MPSDTPSLLPDPPPLSSFTQLREDLLRREAATRARLAEQEEQARTFAAELSAHLPPALHAELRPGLFLGGASVQVCSSHPGAWGLRVHVGYASEGVRLLTEAVVRSSFVEELAQLERRVASAVEAHRAEQLLRADEAEAQAAGLRATARKVLWAGLLCVALLAVGGATAPVPVSLAGIAAVLCCAFVALGASFAIRRGRLAEARACDRDAARLRGEARAA